MTEGLEVEHAAEAAATLHRVLSAVVDKVDLPALGIAQPDADMLFAVAENAGRISAALRAERSARAAPIVGDRGPELFVPESRFLWRRFVASWRRWWPRGR